MWSTTPALPPLKPVAPEPTRRQHSYNRAAESLAHLRLEHPMRPPFRPAVVPDSTAETHSRSAPPCRDKRPHVALSFPASEDRQTEEKAAALCSPPAKPQSRSAEWELPHR